MKPTQIITIAGLGIILLLGACASRSSAPADPTVADMMEQSAIPMADEAAARQALAQQWRRGDQMIAAGDKQQRDAKRNISRAESDIKKAEREIRKQQDRLTKAQKALADARDSQEAGRKAVIDGRRLKETIESDFKSQFPTPATN